jgi:hypothetical protein
MHNKRNGRWGNWKEMSFFYEEESARKVMKCNRLKVDELKSAFRNLQQFHNFRVLLHSSEVKKLGYVMHYCSFYGNARSCLWPA